MPYYAVSNNMSVFAALMDTILTMTNIIIHMVILCDWGHTFVFKEYLYFFTVSLYIWYCYQNIWSYNRYNHCSQ